MLEILEFIFQDHWHWLGTLVIIVAILEGIAGIFKTNKNRNKE